MSTVVAMCRCVHVYALLLGIVGVWMVPQVALASDLEVELRLDGALERPAWVCVASPGQAPGQVEAGEQLRALLKRDPQDTPVPPKQLTQLIAPGSPTRAQQAVLDAATALLQAESLCDDPQRCASTCSQQGPCTARVKLDADSRFIRCTSNATADSGTGVLWLEFGASGGGARATIDELAIHGSLLTITTNLAAGISKELRVLGGHYAPGGVMRWNRGRVPLALAPRCAWRTVRLPPGQPLSVSDAEPSSAKLASGNQKSIALCSRGSLADAPLEVRVPYDPKGSKTLRITQQQTLPDWVVAPSDGPSTTIEFKASWSGALPPEQLPLVPSSVVFFWPRPEATSCFFPTGCPRASLGSPGNRCTSAVTRTDPTPLNAGCYYSCPVPRGLEGAFRAPDAAFSIPITLEDHEHGAVATWGANLNELNQRLRRSVPPSKRKVRIDMTKWCGRDVEIGAEERQKGCAKPGTSLQQMTAEVQSVSLRGGDARTRIDVTGISPSVRFVEIPGARCSEAFEIEYEPNETSGQRTFLRSSAVLTNDGLLIKNPLQRARRLYVSTGISSGGSRIIGPSTQRAAASASPTIAAEVALHMRFRKWAVRRWGFDLPRFVYVLGGHNYQPVPGSGDRRVAYQRFLWGMSVRAPENRRYRISGSFGLLVGVGTPLRSRDANAVGRIDFVVVPTGAFIVRVSRRIDFRASVRLVTLADYHRQQTNLRGHVVDRVRRNALFILEPSLGVAGTW